ncbi:polyprenyl synthetase family protein [Pleomorphovibrio marinus]|uniref:polyprenyl synthetase family protein n=1 Tax=Pleomorphovibrio marinus TaxID=2164132 RepID=UPI000E0A7131|nr:polyprenyl synthetase family protein [Pleomorphovibrio marinus]
MIKSDEIQSIQKALEQSIDTYSFGSQPKALYEPIRYLMNIGGKRIRPLLCLLSYGLYREDYEKILLPAMATEVFHNFTLMHDDIMDQAPLRRGNATVHERWNANTAILSGDVMLVKAYDLLLDVPGEKLPQSIRLFNQTASEVCEGQQLDMDFEAKETVTEPEYIEMIRLKTAVLLGFALKFGAFLADAPEEDQDRLYEFGVNIGIGFQLKDDLLDVYADKSIFGKQVGGDILSNKKTFLLIKAMELAKGELAEKLAYWLQQKDFDKKEKVKAVTEIYDQLAIRSLSESKMRSYFEKGFDQLPRLHPSSAVGLKRLWGLAEDLVNREK